MGRNLWRPQPQPLYFKTGNLVTIMQDLSQRETKAALVCLRKDFPMEGIEHRSKEKHLRSPVMSSVACIEDVTKFESDLPDVFEDSVYNNSKHIEISSSKQHQADSCDIIAEQRLLKQKLKAKDVPKMPEQNSIENIPSVPNILVQHVSSDATAVNHCPVPLNYRTSHADLPVNMFSKKGRTHSDSAIYEFDQKKQCFQNSLSNSRSLSPSPASHMVRRNYLNVDLADYGKKWLVSSAACTEHSSEDDKDDHMKSEFLSQKPQFLQPFLWNFGGIDHFKIAQEKSPKLFWLRRHSDSNVANEDNEILKVELRSQSISSTIPEIQQESVEHKLDEESEKCLHLGRAAVEGCSSDGRKCQKVKKYLQTRYQNQSLDADDVFMDSGNFRPGQTLEEFVSTEAPKLPRIELIRFNSETKELAYSDSPVKLQKRTDSETPKEVLSLCDRVQGQLSQSDDKIGKEFGNTAGSPVVPLLPSRQTIFDFSFPTAYSVLRDLPDGSGNIAFGLLSQNCVSSPLIHSPVPLESFNLQSSSPAGVLVSVLHGKEDYAVSSPGPDFMSESKRWQSGTWDLADCTKRDLQKTERSSISLAEPGCDLDKSTSLSNFKMHQSPCSNNLVELRLGSDGAICFVKNVDKDSDMQSVTFGPAISSRTSLNSLHTLSSPSPSSPAIGTPTRSCPQVVFDCQFSEKINEQRQAGDNANFVCPVCASIFLSYNSLANHVVSHLPSEVITQEGNDSSKVHLCKVCNRSFSRSDMLSRHMRLHTGLRPYECHLCQQVFSRSDHLHTHLRTHTGEKPYRCSHCMYAAPRRDMVTRHMRIHVRGGTRRGRRSSSTSSLSSEVGQTSDDNAVFENSSVHQTVRPKMSSGRGKANIFQKQRNWSLTSTENNDGPESFEDKDLFKMTRTDSTTSIDSGVSYLTPRSLVPSLWSPGIDSPDVFSRYPGHFLWPTTCPEIKHDLEKGVANYGIRDTDFEMHASFQKCQVTSPLGQTFSVNSDELEDQQREEECI